MHPSSDRFCHPFLPQPLPQPLLSCGDHVLGHRVRGPIALNGDIECENCTQNNETISGGEGGLDKEFHALVRGLQFAGMRKRGELDGAEIRRGLQYVDYSQKIVFEADPSIHQFSVQAAQVSTVQKGFLGRKVVFVDCQPPPEQPAEIFFGGKEGEVWKTMLLPFERAHVVNGTIAVVVNTRGNIEFSCVERDEDVIAFHPDGRFWAGSSIRRSSGMVKKPPRFLQRTGQNLGTTGRWVD